MYVLTLMSKDGEVVKSYRSADTFGRIQYNGLWYRRPKDVPNVFFEEA